MNHSMRTIMNLSATMFGTTLAMMMSARTAPQNLLHARYAAAWLGRHQLHLSYPQIGQQMNRDHSTIMHAVQRAEDLKQTDKAFAFALSSINQTIKSKGA